MADRSRITSRQHPVVQRFRRLAARRRRRRGLLLDGEHLVAEALAAGVADRACCSPTAARPIWRTARARPAPRCTSAPAPCSKPPVPCARQRRRRDRDVEAGRRATSVLHADAGARDRPASTCRIPATSAARFAAPTRSAPRGVVVLDRHGRPGRLEGPARRHGQHVPPAGRARLAAEVLRGSAAAPASRSRRPSPTTASPSRPSIFGVPSLVLLGNEGAGLPPDVVAQRRLAVTDPDARRRGLAERRASPRRWSCTRRAGSAGLPRADAMTVRSSPTTTTRAPGHAARRADAAAHARRVRRPGASARPGPAAAARAIEQRRAALADPLGPARHRQDDAGAAAGVGRRRGLRRLQRRDVGHQGDQARSSRRPSACARTTAGGRCCSSTRSIASTRRSRTRSCRTSKAARSCSSARRRRTRRSR